MGNEIILSASKISKKFSGARALIDADFDCCKGQIHALIGENGAGKSTLAKILCGVLQPDSGSITLKGHDIKLASPIDAAKLGIVSVFQELSLEPDLSVAENVFLGSEPIDRLGFIDFNKMKHMTMEIMEKLEFDIDPRLLVRDLSFSQQQLVEIAKALSKKPEIIIFDEATSSLGVKEVDILFKVIKRLVKEQEATVIFISHKLDELERIADAATVYRDGKFVSTFEWGKVSNSEIVNLIAGRKIEAIFPKKDSDNIGEGLVSVKNLTFKKVVNDISLDIRKGEILGIAGLSGHGQTEFMDILFGAIQPDYGEIIIDGKGKRIRNPRSAIKSGLALVPVDRKNYGLLVKRSIGDNLALMSLEKRSRFGFIKKSEENKAIKRIFDLLAIKANNKAQLAGTLSGGNQQKIVLGKAILTEPKILLLSDPTRGIDIGTKCEIYQLIHDLSKSGITIILYSTENNELLGLCDRIAVFRQGSISKILKREEFSETNIIKAAFGFENREGN